LSGSFLKQIFLTGILFIIIPVSSFSQIDDIGFWTGASIQKQITRKLEGSVASQLRLHHDVTEINQIYVDGGIEYSFHKNLKAGLHYRFINSNRENYYSKRHRIYADLAFRQKVSIFTFTLRERIQEQFNDYNSSETGKIPVWVLRSKLSVKFDLDKKYTPYISGELFYLVDNAKEEDNFVSRYRYEVGINYDFNRVHSMNPFVLYQINPSSTFSELVYGITYTFTL
jgi:hypothetical protein